MLFLHVATYNVQGAKVQKWESGIKVTAELIDAAGQEAKGCFVVVECGNSSFYQVLLRTNNMAMGQVCMSSMEDKATCRVAVYDIEKRGLPDNNSIPAVIIKQSDYGQSKFIIVIILYI